MPRDVGASTSRGARRCRSPSPEVEIVSSASDATPLSPRRGRKKLRRVPVATPRDVEEVASLDHQRVIDTVDLCKYVPTPIVEGVIVVESDATPVRERRSNAFCELAARGCPVCFDEFSSQRQPAATLCGHVFCRPCLVKIVAQTKRCPICRKQMKGKGFTVLHC